MTKRPVCFVFGAGTPPACPPKISSRDLVIAADGGYNYTQKAGIKTDALIGDFDSIDAFPDETADCLFVSRLSAEKDQTDLLAALQYGLGRGFSHFNIFGGTGGRLDHTLANVQCLGFLANNGARGYLHDGDSIVTALSGEMRLASRQSGTISVFAFGNSAEGVCLRGLKYELEDAELSCDFPLGVSNEFTGFPVYIKVERGTLLIVYPAGTREIETHPFL